MPFRLMFALLAFMWGAMLDAGSGAGGGSGDQGGSGGVEGDSGGSGGSSAGDSFTLTTSELEARTSKAASDKVSEIAGILGVDLSNTADVKALIEAGRRSQAQQDGQGGSGGGSSAGDEGSGVDAVLDTLEKLENRLQSMETAEETRQRHAAERTRDEKLDEALKGANVRDDRLQAARTIALASGAKLNDKGELVGSKEAIAATKKALPEAFRGDGDTGTAADASGKEKTERRPNSYRESIMAHYQGQKK